MELKDDYDHIDAKIEYILENILYDGDSDTDLEYNELKFNFNSIIINNCKCNVESNCYNCQHGGNYIVDMSSGRTELVLNPQGAKDVIYECNSLCSCQLDKCMNRLVQYGPRRNLDIVYSENYKSKGLITKCDIPPGAFICEYAGELLTKLEAKKRQKANEKNGNMNYIIRLVETNSQNTNSRSLVTIIDPSRRGNIGRYINHSCDPNCKTFSVRIDNPLPKIAIFAKKFIKAGEEITFHYNEGVSHDAVSKLQDLDCIKNNRIMCRCGADTCGKYLPNYEFLD